MTILLVNDAWFFFFSGASLYPHGQVLIPNKKKKEQQPIFQQTEIAKQKEGEKTLNDSSLNKELNEMVAICC